MDNYQVWECKIIVSNEAELPLGFDSPPREAAIDAIQDAGIEVLDCFSGWGGKVSKLESAIMEDDDDKALEALTNPDE